MKSQKKLQAEICELIDAWSDQVEIPSSLFYPKLMEMINAYAKAKVAIALVRAVEEEGKLRRGELFMSNGQLLDEIFSSQHDS